MPKSQTQLCYKALSKLGMPENQAGAEDVQVAQDALPDLVDEISSRDVLSLDLSDDTSAAEIENDVFNALAALLAARIQSEFGRPEPADAEFEALLGSLRRIVAKRPTYEVQQAEYF